MSQPRTGNNPSDDFLNNVNRLANDCRSRLLAASQNLVEETNRLESILRAVPEDQLLSLRDQLIESKREVLRVIDDFYTQMDQRIYTHCASGLRESELERRAQDIFERIAEDQKAINEFSKDLNSKDRCLEVMQVIKDADFDGENRAIQNEIRSYQDLVKQNKVNLVTNRSALDGVYRQLNQYLTIQNPFENHPHDYASQQRDDLNHSDREPLERRSQPEAPGVVYQHSPMKMGGIVSQKGSKKQNPYKYEVESPSKLAAKRETPNRTNRSELEDSYSTINRSRYERPVSPKKEYYTPIERQGRETEKNKENKSYIEDFPRHGAVNDQGPVVVFDNWFEGNHDLQCLHFFQDNSKKLHILDLKKAATSGKFKFDEITLEINFKIPIWHRSIMTKQGTIYLTGGSGAGLANDKNSNDVYVYDPIDRSLRAKAKMNYARNSHGICLSHDYIYVVGGCLDEEGYTNSCERYQISKFYEKSVGEWEKIAPLNKAAYAPSLASYNDTYVYKFGGIMNLNQMNNTIERYNPKTNKWTEITYNLFGTHGSDFSLMAYAGCIQINEDEIYIFGGSNLGEGKSNQTYVCRASDKVDIVQKIEIDLPCRGTFWNNTVIFGGKVYTLQTVQLNKSDAFFLSKRRLLCYNGDYWDEINTDTV